jgi:ribosome-binding protein aMBF1 (putative translation factor)
MHTEGVARNELAQLVLANEQRLMKEQRSALAREYDDMMMSAEQVKQLRRDELAREKEEYNRQVLRMKEKESLREESYRSV